MMAQIETSGSQKISTYVTMIVLIVVALSIVSLILAASVYSASNWLPATFLALIGVVALTMSVFTFYQSRRQAVEMKIEVPKVMSTIECKSCGGKTVREFQRGDYVYKELDACPKCPETKQLITGIYKEVKEKEKTYAV